MKVLTGLAGGVTVLSASFCVLGQTTTPPPPAPTTIQPPFLPEFGTITTSIDPQVIGYSLDHHGTLNAFRCSDSLIWAINDLVGYGWCRGIGEVDDDSVPVACVDSSLLVEANGARTHTCPGTVSQAACVTGTVQPFHPEDGEPIYNVACWPSWTGEWTATRGVAEDFGLAATVTKSLVLGGPPPCLVTSWNAPASMTAALATAVPESVQSAMVCGSMAEKIALIAELAVVPQWFRDLPPDVQRLIADIGEANINKFEIMDILDPIPLAAVTAPPSDSYGNYTFSVESAEAVATTCLFTTMFGVLTGLFIVGCLVLRHLIYHTIRQISRSRVPVRLANDLSLTVTTNGQAVINSFRTQNVVQAKTGLKSRLNSTEDILRQKEQPEKTSAAGQKCEEAELRYQEPIGAPSCRLTEDPFVLTEFVDTHTAWAKHLLTKWLCDVALGATRLPFTGSELYYCTEVTRGHDTESLPPQESEDRNHGNGDEEDPAALPPTDNEPSRVEQFLLLGINGNDSTTKLYHMNVTEIQTDTHLLWGMRREYFRQRGWRARLSLRSVSKIAVTRLDVNLHKAVHIHHHSIFCVARQPCICHPRSHDMTYGDYIFTLSIGENTQNHHPIFSDTFLVPFFQRPGLGGTSKSIYNRLPKKANTPLQTITDQPAIGWGLYFDETWHWWAVSCLVFAGVSVSILLGILMYLITRDWETALSVCQAILGIWMFWLAVMTLCSL